MILKGYDFKKGIGIEVKSLQIMGFSEPSKQTPTLKLKPIINIKLVVAIHRVQ